MRTLQLLKVSLVLFLLCASSVAMAQDQPMPPPAPEGDEPPPSLPQPTPQPMAQPTAQATPAAPANAEMPVERATDGLWGFSWRFGGLATLTANGNSASAGQITVTQIAMKYVPSEAWRILFHFGTSLHVSAPEGGDASTDWGMGMGGGFEYHFRIWRRISPFFGAGLRLGMLDPSGDGNWQFAIGLGPQAGVEYFLGDRISVQALYMFEFGFEFMESLFQFGFSTSAGGFLGLTAYF